MLSILLVSLISLPLQDDTSFVKTLVKSFQYNGEKTIELDLPGEVSVAEWDESYIRVQVQIELKQGHKKIIKALIMSGRYSIQSISENDILRLSLPNHDLEVAGTKIKDKLSYVIQVPRYSSVNNLRRETITSGIENHKFAQ